MVASLLVNVILAGLMPGPSRACNGGGAYHQPKLPLMPPDITTEEPTTTVLPKKKLSPEEREDLTLKGGHGGFVVPEELKKKWQTWLDKYKDNQKLINGLNENGSALDEAANSPGFPESWKDIGIGHVGFPPMEIPPWGYKAKNTGLPSLCYTPPERGSCARHFYITPTPSERWAFNPYLEECKQFRYSGCNGNQNNFVQKLRCEAYCMRAPENGCRLDSDMPIKSLGILFIHEEVPLNIRRCGHEPNV